jgi:hypothetical protein
LVIGFSSEPLEPHNAEGVLQDIPQDTTQRLIIAEDLYPWIIALLVANFEVTPEFFEEHLINSGYGGARYNYASPTSWKKSGMKKSYVSMKWYHPAWRLPVAPFSRQDLENLLNPKCGRLEKSRRQSNELITLETETNIFRSEWDLWTDLRTTTREKRLCGWKKRASIWRGKVPNSNCNLGNLFRIPPSLWWYFSSFSKSFCCWIHCQP